MEKSVLIVDDEEPIRNLLSEIITTQGFKVLTAQNGKEALEIYNKYDCPVIITDLEMPVMGGKELIQKVHTINENTVIIILSVHKEAQLIIDVMKLGVFDYMIKPVTGNEIALKLKRAFETAELRRIKLSLEKEKIKKLENQNKWFEFNENLLKKNYHRFDKAFFESMKTSLTMGAGMGTVLTLLKMIATAAQKKDDTYIIDSDLFEIVNKNAELAENAIRAFADINHIMNENIILKTTPVIQIHNMFREIINDYKKYTAINNNKILLSDPKENYSAIKADINIDHLKAASKELLINALKFSTKDSTIVVIFETDMEKLHISVINNPILLENGIKGIPPEYENIIFEPFYRISKHISSGYDSLDYGLGLTMVDKIIEKHNGKIKASNINDFSVFQTDPGVQVSLTIEFPLQ